VEFKGFDGKVKDLKVALADTDGDGAEELVLVKGGMKKTKAVMRFWKVAQDGAVLVSEVSLRDKHIKAVSAADIDSDGIDEVIVYDGKKVKLADGSELFALKDVTDIVVADVDDDGVVEVVAGKKDGTVVIYELDGTAEGSFRAFSEDEGLSVSAGLLGY
jgi:hypothetical protein